MPLVSISIAPPRESSSTIHAFVCLLFVSVCICVLVQVILFVEALATARAGTGIFGLALVRWHMCDEVAFTIEHLVTVLHSARVRTCNRAMEPEFVLLQRAIIWEVVATAGDVAFVFAGSFRLVLAVVLVQNSLPSESFVACRTDELPRGDICVCNYVLVQGVLRATAS